MNAPTNGVTQSSTRPAEKTATTPGSSVLSLDHQKCHPSPGNRTPTMELVAQRLLPSIGDIGQQVPGIVRDHPAMAGEFDIPPATCDGSAAESSTSRSKRKRSSVMSPRPPSSSSRLTENESAKRCRYSAPPMTFGATSNSKAARRPTSPRGAFVQGADLKGAADLQKPVPELRPLVDNFTIRPSVAFQIASLPSHDLQRQVAEKVIQSDLKRDAVAALVARLKGKKPKKTRPVKGRTPGGLSWCYLGTPEAMLAEAEKLTKALKTLIGNKWDLSLLASVLKG